MATNNQKFKYWGIVLNAPKEKATHEQASDFFNGVLKTLKDYNKILFFASKVHDKDTLDDGTLKTIHMHIEIETYDKLTQLQALKEFSNALSVNKDIMSVRGSNNLFLLVQYLTHKNDRNKTQYNYEEIATNNAEYLEELYNAEYEDRETILRNALNNAKSLTEFMDMVGTIDANKYRNLFRDLKIEQHADLQSVITQYDKIRADYELLLTFTQRLIETLRNGLKEHEKRIINFTDFDNSFSARFKREK